MRAAGLNGGMTARGTAGADGGAAGPAGRRRRTQRTTGGVTTRHGRAVHFVVKLILLVFTLFVLLSFASFLFFKSRSVDLVRRKIARKFGGCTKTTNTCLTGF